MIHVLLGAGADVRVRTSREGATALFYASEQGHTDCVLVLLEAARSQEGTPKGTKGTRATPRLASLRKGQAKEAARNDRRKSPSL